jgi:UDP-N-acetyl-L-fucosamine synthase
MNKLKVMTIVGTRPELIRLSRVINKLDKHMEHILVHTGQNYDYELNEIFFSDLEIRKPNYFLGASGRNASETIANVITKVDDLLRKEEPDAVLILGDTNSCMAAIPAKRKKIPIFHMEAGNRCFDQRVPEEINRRIVDHTADINLTYSSIAREYLLREGLPPDMIIKTGSPMNEVLDYYRDGINSSTILKKLNLSCNNFFVMSIHREENLDLNNNFIKIVQIINSISEKYDLPVIISSHPRTQKKIDQSNVEFHKNVILIKPLGFKDYNKLQLSAKVVLSDSGTINEESSILGFLALNLRENHERPEAMEEASVMMVGLEELTVLQSLNILFNEENSLQKVNDYSSLNVSDKIVRIIHSYTGYVNRVVWKKY